MQFLSQLVNLQGIVTRATLVRPKLQKSVHYCPATNTFMSREYRDVTSNNGPPTNTVYPTKDDSGNLLITQVGVPASHLASSRVLQLVVDSEGHRRPTQHCADG